MLEAAAFCLALNVYHEARGEPAQGQKFVAYVTMNRAGWSEGKVCETVFASSQFSWTNEKVKRTRYGWALDTSLKPVEKAAWAAAQNLARTILTIGRPGRFDPTGGATYYHERTIHPAWDRALKRVATIGNHIFFRVALNQN